MNAAPSRTGREVAVFDLDGTLTTVDTSLPFLRFVAGRGRVGVGLVWGALWAPFDLGVAIRRETRGRDPALAGVGGRLEGLFHERVAVAALRGRTRAELESRARDFAGAVLAHYLRDDARGRIAPHRAAGHHLVLASASLEVYVAPLADALGFDASVGTRLEFRGDVATGRFLGPPCWGVEKLRRVRETLGAEAPEITHAYGDSRGDEALLATARHPIWVR